jgi:hypothetical protein
MTFPEALGVITCRCVLEGGKSVLVASHAGGDWQMYCSWEAHDFADEAAMRKDLLLVHVAHLLAVDPSLEELASLPADMGADRAAVGEPWTQYEDKDD